MGPTYRRLRRLVPATPAPLWLDRPLPTVQPVAVRIRLFLSLAGAIALVVVCTVIVFNQFAGDDGDSPALTGAGEGATPAVADPGEGATLVPAEGQVRISGTISAIHLEGAVLQPRTLSTPLTVTSDRGFGNGGEVTGLTVDGDAASIVWDGGRPFVLSSGGGLVLDPVAVDLVPDGLRLLLGGATHGLVPGTYHLDTPVAVGTSGIATSRDEVTFNAPDGAVFRADGDASLLLGKDVPEHRFAGPGTVHLEGALQLVDHEGHQSSTKTFDLAQGRYDLTFSPDDQGSWTVVGVADRT
jgi:hypothetical protein